ncbi:hypothetical protein K440DRAFT_505245, partial [Wilcoxina mikolae CBS 423.85]
FQESLPDGSTVIPVILDSDKTMLSTLSGNKSARPVDLSIDNLSKVKRRSVKSNGLILIGLLPRCPNGSKTYTIKIVYPEYMATMLHPLEEPAKTSCTRHVYLQIGSFLADYPEQYNITAVKYSWCPRCKIDPDEI